jgi:uncharacterized protein
MVEVETVLLKVASRCNIDCRYCYVFNMGDKGWSRQPKQMSRETYRATVEALGCLAREQRRPFAVVLHGGEPLLLGAMNLRHAILTLRQALPPESAISIQTNGILISREILDLCAEARVTVSVSLDGPRHLHDRNRIGFAGEGTFDKVMRGIERLQTHPEAQQLFTGLLAVIDPTSDPGEVYEFFKSLSPPSVDFIYRDGNHSRLPPGKASLSSTEYGRWMATLLDVYLADRAPLRIRILDDMIKLVLGGTGSKDGVGLTSYGVLIIDTDGSVTRNDTLKSSFDGADRFSVPWSVHTDSLGDVLRSPEFAEYHAMQRPNSTTCMACPDLGVCGGGMTLHRWSDDGGYSNPSVYCEDQKLLIGRIRARVRSLDGAACTSRD